MAGITQKRCMDLLLFWSHKKTFFFMGGGVKTDINQQKHKKIRAEILIRNHVNMMTTVTKTSNTAVMEY